MLYEDLSVHLGPRHRTESDFASILNYLICLRKENPSQLSKIITAYGLLQHFLAIRSEMDLDL